MKTFALAVLLAALAAVAHAGKMGIGACGTQGGCPGVCKSQYGPQATGTCQDNEDFQRCICLHTNQPMKTGACQGGCSWSCMTRFGYQADGFCQRSEDEERCICVNVAVPLHPIGAQGHGGRPGTKRHRIVQHKRV